MLFLRVFAFPFSCGSCGTTSVLPLALYSVLDRQVGEDDPAVHRGLGHLLKFALSFETCSALDR